MDYPFLYGIVVGGCMIVAVEYERYFRPKYGDPKLRAQMLVMGLWLVSVIVYGLSMIFLKN